MSLYVIVAVRKEPLSGHVAYVRWGQAERGVPVGSASRSRRPRRKSSS